MSKNITKIILLLVLFMVSVSFASAQSLKDNPDYHKSVELKQQSEIAFEDGDYGESTRLANESVIYAKRSDEWIAMMRYKYKANYVLKRTATRIRVVERQNAETAFPELLEEGKTLYDQANKLYTEEMFFESYPIAVQAYEVLNGIRYSGSKTTLPAAYAVMDLPGDEDCLWNIAEYKNIYGDATEWEIIYEANKDILPNPGNPHLIKPGMILKIPSLNGEKRSGTWINGSIQ